MSKIVVLFLIVMVGIAFWGRLAANRRIGRFCAHCGRTRPCGCPKGQA